MFDYVACPPFSLETSLYFYFIDVFYINPALPTMKRTI